MSRPPCRKRSESVQRASTASTLPSRSSPRVVAAVAIASTSKAASKMSVSAMSSWASRAPEMQPFLDLAWLQVLTPPLRLQTHSRLAQLWIAIFGLLLPVLLALSTPLPSKAAHQPQDTCTLTMFKWSRRNRMQSKTASRIVFGTRTWNQQVLICRVKMTKLCSF